MNLSCGLVGLPNVGKSTIFNILTKKNIAAAENYPFCTIEPNIASVIVENAKLEKLAHISKSKKIIPTMIKFTDIAGLVKNASKGEGLGNKLLSHIRECNVIIHILRCFENKDITHVENRIDPLNDYELINLELMLSDLAQCEEMIKSKKRTNQEKEIIKQAIENLKNEKMLNQNIWNNDEIELFKQIGLLTYKKMIVVANVNNDIDENLFNKIKHLNPIKLFVENEQLLQSAANEEELEMFKEEFNLKESGIDNLINAAFDALNLITFFTTGEKETKAWKVMKGSSMQKAAGCIHSDFEKHFINAEIIKYHDFIEHNGWNKAKEKGLLKICSKTEEINDNDICLFKIGA